MIKQMKDSEREAALLTADMMLAAAKTAPKSKGRDTVTGMILTGKEKDDLAEKMDIIAKKYGISFFSRDAENLRNSHAVVLLAALPEPCGIPSCGMCGFMNCAEMVKNNGNCALTITDLGIAIGSACSIAADNRIDNRVMFSIGKTAVEAGMFDEGINVCYGIPLYTGHKDIMFDRK